MTIVILSYGVLKCLNKVSEMIKTRSGILVPGVFWPEILF